MVIPAAFFELAPRSLRSHRPLRYDGGGFGVEMGSLAPADRHLALAIYTRVKGFYELWHAHRSSPDWPALRQALLEFDTPGFLDTIQRLGPATMQGSGATPLHRKIFHDLRGGSMNLLVGLAGLTRLQQSDDYLRKSIGLARDQAKIMRNALVDIDLPTRDRDEMARVHGIGDFVDKWSRATLQVEGRQVQVEVVSTFTGDISARCLETSAIDRILYNYLNNAARFAADGQVQLAIFQTDPSLVRWVVANALAEDQRRWLVEQTGMALGRLFGGGLTRGGNGIGLSSCADFVAACFGLDSGAEAVEGAYLGARLVENHFCAWFHWPVFTGS